ncbi:hypothetical protein CDL12_02372 [Handroanthus impetiginosus]|uniref:Uncharacterized protein n=1 Tax=Handroanthus impetiginosus TaxID=429701 RepID=A0A2G9I566_9LAMI|nr:hypothetical protein CDL12_02372 [Handroanthus impetiginosus]
MTGVYLFVQVCSDITISYCFEFPFHTYRLWMFMYDDLSMDHIRWLTYWQGTIM